MNERIKDLVISAGGRVRNVCHGHGDYRNELQLSDKAIEKFTELIVTQVLSEVYDEIQYNYSHGLAKEICDRVGSHFGMQ